ncbi:hypothetical protein AJ85_02740 [Alkalihalobacillus alcalophilus ATCC 27647 = CGMCC 1.3604]|uniref:Uncharacterized protein n=1 Tax=Alkalihalobacillus alcalophilus ATCC 27647 = CGMCC 1.3604 TaxID=1218173 RepID=A0A4S4JTU3_ALKAL|nr:hypothetical protein AJ85_02740 [Alkalihalobacillus alcalophilus ATCC 27647 = CGMCC 1.3604]
MGKVSKGEPDVKRLKVVRIPYCFFMSLSGMIRGTSKGSFEYNIKIK